MWIFQPAVPGTCAVVRHAPAHDADCTAEAPQRAALPRQAGTTRLYYIPFGSIGTGEKYEPLPLPEITDPRERPQPVLRPATR
ncbi:MAG: hypothetical protein A2167_02380 [Planctomycetes bacterium RBG_13_46_10]|nr:MAG: hypothetical protein A2167_02380 [Planctomycetes bacterium RBG_13_46_10]